MVIIRLNGGLGNQMFQISLGKKLETLGKKVLYDNKDILQRVNVKNMTVTYNVFDLGIKFADQVTINKYSDRNTDIVSRLRRVLFGYKKSYYKEIECGNIDSNIFNLDEVYLDGYWQCYKYFEDCREEIINCFKFKELDGEKNLMFKNMIVSNQCSVSIHLRLEDYLNLSNIYGNICTKEYYDLCTNYFNEIYTNPHFFVFSDNKDYILELFKNKSFTVIDCNNEKNAWKDMYLMSLCKHNIIANSSFSWWGAYLNNNINKTIIAPKKWLNTFEMKDICPEDYIRF